MAKEQIMGRAVIPVSLLSLGGSIVLGCSIGILVSLDALLAPSVLPARLQAWPWSLSLLLAIIAGGGSLGYWILREFWTERYTLFLLLFIVMTHLTGVDKLGSPNPLNLVFLLVVPILLWESLTAETFVFRSSPLFFLTWGLLLCVALSALNAGLVKGLQGFFSFCLRSGIFVTVVQLLRQRIQVRYVVEGLIWTGIGSGVVGVGQFILWLVSGHILTLVSLEDIVAPTPWGMFLRAPALFNTPNSFGEIMAISLTLALVLVCTSRITTWKKACFLVGMAPMLAALLLSFSRGSWVAFGAVLVISPFFLRPAWCLHIMLSYCSIGALLWATGALRWLLETIRFLNPAGVHTRQDLFKLGLEAVRRHPFVGVGIYSFEDFSGNAERLPVHNAFLQMASETGVLGGLLFTLLVCMAGYRLLRTVSQQAPGAERSYLQALLLGLAIFTVHMLGEPTANHPIMWMYLGFVEGSVLLYQDGTTHQAQPGMGISFLRSVRQEAH
jgi:hypothetical protein